MSSDEQNQSGAIVALPDIYDDSTSQKHLATQQQQHASSTSVSGRTSPMFSFKQLTPLKKRDSCSENLSAADAAERESRIAEASQQLRILIGEKLKEKMVFLAHERSAHKIETMSCNADKMLDSLGTKVERCKDDQRKFFKARKRIVEASCKQAQTNHIAMEMLDSTDSDDSRENFYHNHAKVSTRWASYHAERFYKKNQFNGADLSSSKNVVKPADQRKVMFRRQRQKSVGLPSSTRKNSMAAIRA